MPQMRRALNAYRLVRRCSCCTFPHRDGVQAGDVANIPERIPVLVKHNLQCGHKNGVCAVVRAGPEQVLKNSLKCKLEHEPTHTSLGWKPGTLRQREPVDWEKEHG